MTRLGHASGPERPLVDRMSRGEIDPPGVACTCAVQITRFGGPEVLDVVDLPDPVPTTASSWTR
jgi:hypothetical protein